MEHKCKITFKTIKDGEEESARVETQQCVQKR